MQYMGTFPDGPKSETELVRGARRGDESAFADIYQRHRSAVFQFSWRLSGSFPIAEDVTQECFLALLQGAAFDGDRGGLRAYLLGIARNLLKRRLRISEREVEELDETMASIDVLGDLLTAERSELVSRAVAQLPLLQREAIVLFTYEEMSLEEISAIMHADVGAVKSRLRRARESLHAILARLLAQGSGRRNL